MRDPHAAALLGLLALGCGGSAVAPEVDAAATPASDAGLVDTGAPFAGDSGTNGDDAAPTDAHVEDAAPQTEDAAPPRCTTTATRIDCARQTLSIRVGTPGTDRVVHFQVPSTSPPASGFPVVLMFQGSGISASRTFSGQRGDTFGLYYQAAVVRSLLDGGYAVIAPEAKVAGTTFWDTNIPPWSSAWTSSEDHQLMLALFAGIARGDFGPLDATRLFAAGISSGGYMSSRMAVSYPGRFRALAIESASYATCGGALCVLPATLPADHPPTLFLHGRLDTTVPLSTMQPYAERLTMQGTTTRVVIDPGAGHTWIAAAPAEVRPFFDTYR